MLKTIEIDGRDVPFKATASTIRRYQEMFGRDLLQDFQKLDKAYNSSDEVPMTSDVLSIFEELAYTMARQADPTIPNDPDDWLDQFDVFPVNDIFPQIVELWAKSMGTSVELKKTAIAAQRHAK